MYDQILYEMAEAVSQKCNIRLDDAFNTLIGYWQDKIACCWDVDEMLASARRAGKPITRTEAVELLKQVFDQYNPELGITWLTLDVALDDYCLRFENLPVETYPEVQGVFQVWREGKPVARQFGLFPDKVNGNLPEALAFAQTLAHASPGMTIFVGCALLESSRREAQPWLNVLFANEGFKITQGATHVRMD